MALQTDWDNNRPIQTKLNRMSQNASGLIVWSAKHLISLARNGQISNIQLSGIVPQITAPNANPKALAALSVVTVYSAQHNGNGETRLARLKHVRCARVAAERS